MNIIIQKKYLAPIFENVISLKNEIERKNPLLEKKYTDNINERSINLENTKPLSANTVINKKVTFIKLYDKTLYLFISKLINKNRGIIEPKTIENTNNQKIEGKNNKTNINQYGQIKMITPVKINTNQSNLTNLKKVNIEENTLNYIKYITRFNPEIAKSYNITYQYNKGNKISSTSVNSNIFTILESAFLAMSSFISKPVFVFTPNKVIIQLFYFLDNKKFNSSNNSKFLSINKSKLELLCLHLSKFYKKPVELELDRIYQPYFDSNILANLIGLISKTKKLRFIIRELLNASNLGNSKNMNMNFNYAKNNNDNLFNSFISGINLRVAGRLLTQRVVPRMSVKTIQRGTLARGKTNLVNTARFTDKNKRGAYSITVTLGHVFF
jgi:Mitochondrial ribosomal protein (VAR1)